MIRINLLPDAGGKKAKRGGEAAPRAGSASDVPLPAILIAFVLVVIGGGLGWNAYSNVQKALGDADKVVKEKQRLEKEIAGLSTKAAEVRKQLARLQVQFRVLEALDPPDRILWSEKLAELSRIIPKDVFLSEIRINESVRQVAIPASAAAIEEWEKGGRKGPKPEVENEPEITYNLSLTGFATGLDNKEQFANVLAFEEALRTAERDLGDGTKRRFSDQFEPIVNIEYISAVLFDKQYPVNEFVFTMKTKPPARKTEPAKPKGTE